MIIFFFKKRHDQGDGIIGIVACNSLAQRLSWGLVGSSHSISPDTRRWNLAGSEIRRKQKPPPIALGTAGHSCRANDALPATSPPAHRTGAPSRRWPAHKYGCIGIRVAAGASSGEMENGVRVRVQAGAAAALCCAVTLSESVRHRWPWRSAPTAPLSWARGRMLAAVESATGCATLGCCIRVAADELLG